MPDRNKMVPQACLQGDIFVEGLIVRQDASRAKRSGDEMGILGSEAKVCRDER